METRRRTSKGLASRTIHRNRGPQLPEQLATAQAAKDKESKARPARPAAEPAAEPPPRSPFDR